MNADFHQVEYLKWPSVLQPVSLQILRPFERLKAQAEDLTV